MPAGDLSLTKSRNELLDRRLAAQLEILGARQICLSVPLQPAMPLFINDTPPLGNEVALPRSHAHWSMVPGVVFHLPMHIFHE
jgi:hypothetical protein